MMLSERLSAARSCVTSTLWPVRTALVLLCCAFAIRCAAGGCPSPCLCVSDIIICGNQNLSTMPTDYFQFISLLDLSYNRITSLSSNWTKTPLEKLHTLILNHNAIAHISQNVFSWVSHLKWLDLSSNKVSALNTSVFQDLMELEVLLLFNNHMVTVAPVAFGGIPRLQLMYLSQNRLSEFPLDLFVGKLRLPRLEFLDLSYNLIRKVPVQSIISLPAWQQSGLYLHQNQLTCDCTLHTMLLYWSRRNFPSVMDFRGDYKCILPHFNVAISVFSEMDFMKCSKSAVNSSFYFYGRVYNGQVGSSLVMHCDTKIPMGNTVIFWVSPGQKVLTLGTHSENLSAFPNGSLGLSHARSEDSGIYTCIVVNRGRNLNETIEMTVRVSNTSANSIDASENFHTAFTTLASCVVSIVLVLIYLYLMPCRCRSGCKPTGQGKHLPPPAPPLLGKERKGIMKRVAFLEPPAEYAQNGKAKPIPLVMGGTGGILKSSSATPTTVPSVLLDSPLIP